MAMKLSEVKAKSKTATVEWDDEQVEVCYLPNQFTPEVLEAVTAAESENNLRIIGVMLEPILSWWDVLDDKDKRIPTTAENIATMPLAFLMKVLDDLQADMNPPASKD